MSTELAKPTLVDMLNSALPALKQIAPKYVNLTRLISLAIEAKMRNPLLENCSPISVLNFCKKCAEMGVDRVGAGGMVAAPGVLSRNPVSRLDRGGIKLVTCSGPHFWSA